MRKELLVYVDTAERGETLSVAAIATNREFVVLNSTAGRMTASVKELIEALNTIREFDKTNNPTTVDPPTEAQMSFDVEYTNEE